MYFVLPVNLRTRMDLITPDIESNVQKQQAKQKKYHDQHCRHRELGVGQEVWARNGMEGLHWRKGVICDRLGPRPYFVELEGGELWRRQINQLHKGTTSPLREPQKRELQENWELPPLTIFSAEGAGGDEKKQREGQDRENAALPPADTARSTETLQPSIELPGQETVQSSLTPTGNQGHSSHSSRYPTRVRH